ncbi:hypothetical protein Ancab_000757 [Ancistrocladus abbreviatus]
MLSRLVGSSRVLAAAATTLTTRQHGQFYHKTRLSGFPAFQNNHGRRVVLLVRRMASSGEQFPPQKQESQPGKEHVMDPTPQATNPEYKAANKLQGKVALVTGGDSGIGRAVCHCFVLEGATVAFTYVKGHEDKDAQDTIQMLKKAKSPDAKDPIAIPADLGFDENCKKVIDEVVSAFGCIDILVNNAAEQYEARSVEEIDEQRLERVFRTNIFSYFFVSRHSVKHMKAGSSIINTTSINAYRGNAKLLDYTATKGAIVAFTRGLALQLVDKGIRVNGVAPGPIWTPLIPASFKEEKVKNFGAEVPMKRAGQPIEVAPSYVFLASNADSSYITGQVLHPNGDQREKEMAITLPGGFSMSRISALPPNHPFLVHQMKTQNQNRIIYAKWNRKRSGSQRSQRVILQSIAFIASRLKILPEPLDFVIREFGGGNGGKTGFKNAFGGGGFDGWKRRRAGKFGFWVFLAFSGLVLWVVVEREEEEDLFWVLLAYSAVVLFCMLKGWKGEIKGWALGFCSGACLVGLGLKSEIVGKWVERLRVRYPILRIANKRRRKVGRR